MSNEPRARLFDVLAGSIEIPDSAYDRAERRYRDLGDWLGRESSTCANHDPHVFPQGSFRIGTAIRPIDGSQEYDLDLACELRTGISKETHSQEYLKQLVGSEVEAYRGYRKIEDKLEEKHRCWRLAYKDEMKFHMDIVPCIPEDSIRRDSIRRAISQYVPNEVLAGTVSSFTVGITDDRHPLFRTSCGNWNISNPEGYARWFDSRTRLADLGTKGGGVARMADVDALPAYRWKTPLQRCVQILKRHRDVMFADDPESKPASVIITTLAAMAYSGQSDIDEAMRGMMDLLANLVNRQRPRIPNPVNPAEDFADAWTAKGGRSRLEDGFWMWIEQAKADFQLLRSSDDMNFVSKQAASKLSATPDVSLLAGAMATNAPSVSLRRSVSIVSPPRPWSYT